MTSARSDAEGILTVALAAADPRRAVGGALGERPITPGGRVLVVAAGKAACGMAEGAIDRLGDRVRAGIVTTVDGAEREIRGLTVCTAGHPRPDERGARAAEAVFELAGTADEGDTVLVLLSGGGSALWTLPAEGVSLAELRATSEALLRSGAPIGEVNTVRRHLSRIGGGRLAQAAHPARVVTLAMSDVVGDDPAAIASGPTVADPSTFADALEVVRRRGVQLPDAVLEYLRRGTDGSADEGPAPDHPSLRDAEFRVVARNRDALRAAAKEAERRGYSALVVTDRLVGEAREVGRALGSIALGCRDAGMPIAPPAALLLGGETTVTVRGSGSGGRNQELALAAAVELDGSVEITLASLGTDGIDGPTDAAGAIVDGGTLARGRRAGLAAREHLARNDAHPFLEAAGDLHLTGPTGTNVNDVVMILVRSG